MDLIKYLPIIFIIILVIIVIIVIIHFTFKLNKLNQIYRTIDESLMFCNGDKFVLENSLTTCNNSLTTCNSKCIDRLDDNKWSLNGFVPGNGNYGITIIENTSNNKPISNNIDDTLENCKIACEDNTSCKQFTYDVQNKNCKLYSNTGVNYAQSNSGPVFTYSKLY